MSIVIWYMMCSLYSSTNETIHWKQFQEPIMEHNFLFKNYWPKILKQTNIKWTQYTHIINQILYTDNTPKNRDLEHNCSNLYYFLVDSHTLHLLSHSEHSLFW